MERPRRQRRQRGTVLQQQEDQGDGPLPGLNGVNQAGELVQNTAGNAVNGVTNTAGKAVGGVLGGNKGENKGDEKEDRDEQLRLRLDLNLDIEVQLKAKIHGDLTLGLLSVMLPSLDAVGF